MRATKLAGALITAASIILSVLLVATCHGQADPDFVVIIEGTNLSMYDAVDWSEPVLIGRAVRTLPTDKQGMREATQDFLVNAAALYHHYGVAFVIVSDELMRSRYRAAIRMGDQ